MAEVDWSVLLGPEGPLRAAIPRLELRPGQVEMARIVAAALEDGSRVAIEAGTGTGKTFAYLLPALRWAREPESRVVISTWTRSLQEQIVGRDVPLLRRAFDLPATVALVQGRQNYVCRRRAEDALFRDGVRFGSVELHQEHQAIASWAAGTREGRRSELPFVPTAEAWGAVRAESGKCQGQRSPFFGDCAWQGSRRRMREASVLVVNHAVLLADLEGRRRGAPLLPPYSALIVDEAHHLEEVAASHLGLRLSRAALMGRLKEIENWSSQEAPSLGGALDVAREYSLEFFAAVSQRVGKRRSRRFRRRLEVEVELPAALVSFAAAIDSLGEGEGRPAGSLDREADAEELRGMARSIGQWLEGEEEPDCVVWAERGTQGGLSLCSAPTHPAEMLERELFDTVGPAVLTGASLRVPDARGDGFEYLRENTGCRGAIGHELPSPFDYQRQARLVVDWLPEPSQQEQWLEALAERIPIHVQSSAGRAFVLFTSRSTMEQTARGVAEALELAGIELLVQGRGAPRSVLLQQFRSRQPAVLFGLASFWEGVDVPGDDLVQVVLTRLPFAVPDHPLEEERNERLRAAGFDPFHARALPDAVLRWKQGFGRLIRSRHDHGQVTVLDRRILSRPWGRQFLDALPRCPRVLLRDGRERPFPD